MIYDELRMKTYRDNLPLRDAKHHLTFVTSVIPGIAILATCRQIRAEASNILQPRLEKILLSLPVISVRAEHIIGLLDLHDCYSSIYGATLLRKLIACLHGKRAEHKIIWHRQQGLPAQQLRKKLHLKELIAEHDEASINAFARFVLRAAKHIATYPANPYRYPPLSLVLEVPKGFHGISVTTTTSWMKNLCYKLMTPLRPAPPRSVTGHADLCWLIRRLMFHLSFSCQLWRVVSLVVRLKRLGVSRSVQKSGARSVQRAIVQGLEDAKGRGPPVVHYGGKIDPKDYVEI